MPRCARCTRTWQSRRLVYEVLRRMINRLVTDLIDSSTLKLREAGVASIQAVRAHSAPLIGFSETTRELNRGLKTFLRQQVYKHCKVQRMTSKARRVVRQLFDAFFAEPGLMPDEHRATGSRRESIQGPSGPRAGRGRLHCRHDRPVCHAGTPSAVRSERKNMTKNNDDALKNDLLLRALAARTDAAPADLAHAPGGTLPARVPRHAQAGREFPGDVHESARSPAK